MGRDGGGVKPSMELLDSRLHSTRRIADDRRTTPRPEPRSSPTSFHMISGGARSRTCYCFAEMGIRLLQSRPAGPPTPEQSDSDGGLTGRGSATARVPPELRAIGYKARSREALELLTDALGRDPLDVGPPRPGPACGPIAET